MAVVATVMDASDNSSGVADSSGGDEQWWRWMRMVEAVAGESLIR